MLDERKKILGDCSGKPGVRGVLSVVRPHAKNNGSDDYHGDDIDFAKFGHIIFMGQGLQVTV